MRGKGRLTIKIAIIAVVSLLLIGLLLVSPLTPKRTQKHEYVFVPSTVDRDRDGVDDYTDIMLGARADAARHPTYDDRYWEEGYPPESIGVCADVVWRAFRDAGYSLREMVDNDIARSPISYSSVYTPDSKIDFRRVVNLKVFFSRHAVELTTDVNDTDAWQAGDIVIFGNNVHIGIISDKRNEAGQPYVIHNGGQADREQDYLTNPKNEGVTAHYRFDASRIDPDVLVSWDKAQG